MLELGTFGSVRGVPGDGYPYRNPRPEAADHDAEFGGTSGGSSPRLSPTTPIAYTAPIVTPPIGAMSVKRLPPPMVSLSGVDPG